LDTSNTIFDFDANGSTDIEDSIDELEVRWDFDGDGVYETDWSFSKNISHQFPENGIYSVKLLIRDTEYFTGSISNDVVVEVTNQAPEASFTVLPSSGTTDTIFQFDANGCSDFEDPSSSLEIRWDFDGDSNYDTDWSTEKIVEHQYGEVDIYNAQVIVRDSEGLNDTFELSINVASGSAVPGEMVFVEGGTFEMGDFFNEGNSFELPMHDVTLDAFYIGKYEVTQGEWQNIMGSNPSIYFGVGESYPVYNINWRQAIDYCNALSISEGLTPCYTITGEDVICDFNANGYRLPTEAEWEYVAKGGINWNDNLRYSGCLEESDLTNYAKLSKT